MHSHLRLALALVFAAALPLARAQTTAAKAPAPKPDASAAIEKTDPSGKFQRMHVSFLERGKAGPIGVLFLGDSITEGWGKAPHIWEHYYGKMQPANFGIGGDQTQHVIWRIANGELNGIAPKVIVLMLGTNNTGANTAKEIAEADKKIISMIREKLPTTKVLLLAIFPRGARKNNEGVITEAATTDASKRMEIITEANAQLAKLDDGKTVRFLDINAVFVGQDGKIPFALMPDQLHPNAAGYQLWADAMKSTLDAMMK